MPSRAKTFAWAAQFLPKQSRTELNALYSFCRYVDDGVDHCSNKVVATKFLDQIDQDLKIQKSGNEQVSAFLKLASARNIPLGFAFDLVRGVRTDIDFTQTKSIEELLRYSYQVAGTVGVIICYLLEVTNSDALAAAIDLGIAMQLTNIARDVREDFAQGRIYLPVDLIDRASVTEALSGNLEAQGRVASAVNEVLAISQTYYRSSENGICFLPAEARLSILCASRAYNQIGKLIVKRPQSIFNERVSTSAQEKVICLFSSLLSLSQARYHSSALSPSHKRELHNALKGLPSFDVAYH